MFTIQDMSEQDRNELLARTLHPTTRENRDRRKEFWARYLAMRERPIELILERIGDTFHTPEIIQEVSRFATGIFNPIRRLSDLLAKVYSSPPIRRVDRLSAEAEADYLQALRRLRFNTRARTWNQWQVATNTLVVLVKPARRANGDPTLDFDKVTGACGEVEPHPDAPFGDTPGVLAYTLARDGDPNSTDPESEEIVATVDARWWAFWNRQSQLVRVVEHGLGIFPGAILRGTEPEGQTVDDYWDPDTGRAATEALREAGLNGAIMGWTRKTQFGKLIALLKDPDSKSDETEDEEGQPLGDPEGVIEVTGDELRVEDIEVKIDAFRDHMGVLLAGAARSVTGTASILDEPKQGQTVSDTAAVHRHAALRQAQDEQAGYLEDFEHDINTVIAAMGTRIGMRGIPSPQAVKEGFSVTFRPLTFLDTPAERVNVAIAQTKFGVTDQVEYLMQERGISEQEARELVMEIAARVAELNKLRTRESSPSDPTDPADAQNEEIRPELPGEGSAEATGRQGGRATSDAA